MIKKNFCKSNIYQDYKRINDKQINERKNKLKFKNLILFYLHLLLILFIFLYSINSVNSQYNINDYQNTGFNPLFSDNVFIKLILNNSFYLSSHANNVKVQLEFFPEDSFNQQVLSLKTEPEAKNIGYAYVYEFNSLNKGYYDYILISDLRTSYNFNNISKKVDFPINKEELPKEVLIYLMPTKKIDINDDILKKANELAYGQDDLFNVVFRLASWVNNNIEYTLTTKTAEASQKASWVLENKYGVCDELTNLFIAMCRSLGIPARFVSGISYTDSELFSENWGLHGWAEVYFPGYGWIAFDPTYGQYGYLDPGHIKLKDSLDSDKSSTKYEWQSKSADLSTNPFNFNVYVEDYGKKIDSPLIMNLKPYYNEVSFGSYNLIVLELENKLNNYLAFEVFLNKPKEVSVISLSEDYYFNPNSKSISKKYVYLKPLEKKSVFWIVKVDDSLSKKYIYSFPLMAINNFNFSVISSFNASNEFDYYSFDEIKQLKDSFEIEKETYKKDLYVKCDYETYYYVNETMNITCNFENRGNIFFKNLRACIKNCVYFDLGINENKNFTFSITSNKFGKNNFTLLVSNKDIAITKNFDYYLEDIPKLSIENVIIPDELKYEDFEISFEIWKHSISKPKNVTIIFRFNDYEEKWFYEEVESNMKFKVKIDKSLIMLGNNTISIYFKKESFSSFIEDAFKKDIYFRYNFLFFIFHKIKNTIFLLFK
ncbi:MAG: transglutaminase-like domain-containing protein [Candidatus Woesearchaeota archaeon]